MGSASASAESCITITALAPVNGAYAPRTEGILKGHAGQFGNDLRQAQAWAPATLLISHFFSNEYAAHGQSMAGQEHRNSLTRKGSGLESDPSQVQERPNWAACGRTGARKDKNDANFTRWCPSISCERALGDKPGRMQAMPACPLALLRQLSTRSRAETANQLQLFLPDAVHKSPRHRLRIIQSIVLSLISCFRPV